MKEPRTILVTGGAGFIGSAVVRHIIENTNDIVINVDKLTYAGNLDNVNEVSGNLRYCFVTGIVTLPPRVSATAARTDPPCHRRIVVSGGCPLQQ